MHCYFHLSNGKETVLDQEGIEVNNAEEAYTQAHEAVEEILGEDELEAKEWSGWHIQVTDVSGTLLYEIELKLAETEATLGEP